MDGARQKVISARADVEFLGSKVSSNTAELSSVYNALANQYNSAGRLFFGNSFAEPGSEKIPDRAILNPEQKKAYDSFIGGMEKVVGAFDNNASLAIANGKTGEARAFYGDMSRVTELTSSVLSPLGFHKNSTGGVDDKQVTAVMESFAKVSSPFADRVSTEKNERFPVEYERSSAQNERTGVLNERMTVLTERTATEAERTEQNAKQVDKRVAQIDERIGKIDERIAKIDARIGQIDEKIRPIDERIDKLEKNFYDTYKSFTIALNPQNLPYDVKGDYDDINNPRNILTSRELKPIIDIVSRAENPEAAHKAVHAIGSAYEVARTMYDDNKKVDPLVNYVERVANQAAVIPAQEKIPTPQDIEQKLRDNLGDKAFDKLKPEKQEALIQNAVSKAQEPYLKEIAKLDDQTRLLGEFRLYRQKEGEAQLAALKVLTDNPKDFQAFLKELSSHDPDWIDASSETRRIYDKYVSSDHEWSGSNLAREIVRSVPEEKLRTIIGDTGAKEIGVAQVEEKLTKVVEELTKEREVLHHRTEITEKTRPLAEAYGNYRAAEVLAQDIGYNGQDRKVNESLEPFIDKYNVGKKDAELLKSPEPFGQAAVSMVKEEFAKKETKDVAPEYHRVVEMGEAMAIQDSTVSKFFKLYYDKTGATQLQDEETLRKQIEGDSKLKEAYKQSREAKEKADSMKADFASRETEYLEIIKKQESATLRRLHDAGVEVAGDALKALEGDKAAQVRVAELKTEEKQFVDNLAKVAPATYTFINTLGKRPAIETSEPTRRPNIETTEAPKERKKGRRE